jgi:iron complex outermembrane receptor protein
MKLNDFVGLYHTDLIGRFPKKAWAIAIAIGIAMSAGGIVAIPAANAAQNSGTQLEEIVVTARFRSENLQQTPLAVSAFTAEGLAMRAVTNVDQLGKIVPNAYINPGGINPVIGIRGVIQSDFMYAFEPAVGMYIDDVYFGTLVGSGMDLVDVERVEVLRGPQGTLFGKNSIGGSIRLISKKPEGSNTGYIQGGYGSLDRLEAKGAYDATLIADKLYMRANFMMRDQKGYIKRLDFTCQMKANGTPELAGIGDGIIGATQVGATPPPLGSHPIYAPVMGTPGSAEDNAFSFPEMQTGAKDCVLGRERGYDRKGGRVQLRYVGTEDLDVLLEADLVKSDDPQWGAVMYAPPFSGLNHFYNDGVLLPHFGIKIGDGRFMTNDPYSTFATYSDPVNGQSYPDREIMTNWGTSATIDYKIRPNISAKLVSAFREYNVTTSTDNDNTPIAYNDLASAPLHHQQWSEELQFNGTAFDSRLNWTAGGFYYHASESRDGHVTLQPIGFLGILNPFEVHDTWKTTNLSGYLHASYDVTEALQLSGGVRYTSEDKSYTFDHGPALPISLPAIGKNRRWDWNATINYKVTPDIFVYASAATGFRSPAFNPRPFTPGQLQAVPAEQVRSYEGGFKGDLLDHRLRVNADVFYMEYDPRLTTENATQCTAFDSLDPGPPLLGGTGQTCPPGTPLAGLTGLNWFYYANVPGKDKGAELEITADPVENLTLTYSLGYNKFTSPQRNSKSLIQPSYTMSGSIQYTIPLSSDMGQLVPRLDWSYRSHNTNSASNVAPTPDNIIPAFNLFNARLTYNTNDGLWSASLEVTNLFDKLYYYSIEPPNGLTRSAVPGEPREWAFILRRNF